MKGALEVVAAIVGVLVIAAVYGFVAIVRLREKVSTMEEWIRQAERRNGTR